MKYTGLIFAPDYFEDKAAESIAALSEHVNNHDVYGDTSRHSSEMLLSRS